MSMPALADYLEDFGPRRAPAPEVLHFAMPEAHPQEAFSLGGPPLALPEADDVEERIREAVDSAEADLTTRLTAQYEAMLEAEREAHAAEVERLGREAGGALAARISSEFAATQETVTGLVTTVVSRILGPLLTEDITRRSVTSLAEALKSALADAEGVRVRITGSPALYEALCAAAGDKVDLFDFTEGASMDLSVRIDESLFETRVSEWSAAMEKAFG